jgi:hypothetical protein
VRPVEVDPEFRLTAGALLALRFYPDREESPNAAGRLGSIAVRVDTEHMRSSHLSGTSIRLRVSAFREIEFRVTSLRDFIDFMGPSSRADFCYPEPPVEINK